MLLHGDGTVEVARAAAVRRPGPGAHRWPVSERRAATRCTDWCCSPTVCSRDTRVWATNAWARTDCSSWRVRSAALPGAAFVDALIDGAEELAQAHGGLTDDIAVVRVERTELTGETKAAGQDRGPEPGRRPDGPGMAESRAGAHGSVGARGRDRARRYCWSGLIGCPRTQSRDPACARGGLSVAGRAARPGDSAPRVCDRGRPAVPRPLLRRAAHRDRRRPTEIGSGWVTAPEQIGRSRGDRTGRRQLAGGLRRAADRRRQAGLPDRGGQCDRRTRQSRIRPYPRAFSILRTSIWPDAGQRRRPNSSMRALAQRVAGRDDRRRSSPRRFCWRS